LALAPPIQIFGDAVGKAKSAEAIMHVHCSWRVCLAALALLLSFTFESAYGWHVYQYNAPGCRGKPSCVPIPCATITPGKPGTCRCVPHGGSCPGDFGGATSSKGSPAPRTARGGYQANPAQDNPPSGDLPPAIGTPADGGPTPPSNQPSSPTDSSPTTLGEASPGSPQQFTLKDIQADKDFRIVTSDGLKISAQQAATLPIDSGAVAITGKSGAKITFPDGTVLTIPPNKRMALQPKNLGRPTLEKVVPPEMELKLPTARESECYDRVKIPRDKWQERGLSVFPSEEEGKCIVRTTCGDVVLNSGDTIEPPPTRWEKFVDEAKNYSWEKFKKALESTASDRSARRAGENCSCGICLGGVRG
jgi:hypothetical protein